MAGSGEPEDSCYLSVEQNRAIFVTKLIFLCASLVLNTAAILLLLCFKSYRRFVFRLVLCLLVASLLGVVVQVLELIPLDQTKVPMVVREGWEATCAAFGFLDTVTLWMSNFVIVWIVLYLCWLMCQAPERINLFETEVSVREAVTITCCFLVPFTFNWIPFTSNYFGASGSWCWIKFTTNVSDSCEDDRDIGLGATYMFVFYYGPLIMLMLFASVVSLIALLNWCRSLATSDPIKGMIFLVVYPVMFNVVCCIVTANRIEELRRQSINEVPNYGLWMAHAVADPARTFLPAVLFLFQFLIPTTRRMVMETRKSPRSQYVHINSGEHKKTELHVVKTSAMDEV